MISITINPDNGQFCALKMMANMQATRGMDQTYAIVL